MLKRYESLSSFLDDATNGPLVYNDRDRKASSTSYDWDLGVSGAKAIELARTGDRSLVPSTVAGLDRLQFETGDHDVPRMVDAMIGSRVNVPAYLQGNPLCMRRRTRRQIAARHVSIYVNVVFSGGVTAADLLRRGLAIMGLVDALQRQQVSTDLYLVSITDANKLRENELIQIVPIDVRPLDLSVAGFALAHPAVARNLFYGLAGRHGLSGYGWPSAFTQSDFPGWCRKRLDLGPQDIYLPHVSYREGGVGDAQAWIAARMSQIAAAVS